MGRPAIPDLDTISDDTPLRLAIAAAVAYPDGSMTAAGLRREAARGRLAIERTAGKDYTTLAYIREMRQKCRAKAKDPDSGLDRLAAETESSRTRPSGSSATPDTRKARDAALTMLEGLSKRSPPTSAGNTSRKRPQATVIPLKRQ